MLLETSQQTWKWILSRNILRQIILQSLIAQEYETITTHYCLSACLLQIRLYSQPPTLTNRITIDHSRFRVEESRRATRPYPCWNCMQYHDDKDDCSNEASCFKCGKSHQSSTCFTTPNKNYCASCKKIDHRSASSICPLRPLQGEKTISKKYFDLLKPVQYRLTQQISNNHLKIQQIRINTVQSHLSKKLYTRIHNQDKQIDVYCLDVPISTFRCPPNSTVCHQTSIRRDSSMLHQHSSICGRSCICWQRIIHEEN